MIRWSQLDSVKTVVCVDKKGDRDQRADLA